MYLWIQLHKLQTCSVYGREKCLNCNILTMLHVTIQCLRSLLVMRELYSYTGGSHSVGLNLQVDIFVFFFFHIFFCLVLVFFVFFFHHIFPFWLFPSILTTHNF